MDHRSTKPPNVLLLTDDCNSPDCLTWRTEIEACLGSQFYTVYPLGITDVTDLPWKEVCKCLIVPTNVPFNEKCLKELLTFISNGGKCISTNNMLNRELLETSLVPQEDGENSCACEVRPLNSELETFVSYKIAASSMQGASDSANVLKWKISTLASLCLESPGPSSVVTPCVNLLECENENGCLSCVVSAVELLSPWEYTKVAAVAEIAKLKESQPARLRFLRWVFDKLGIKGGPAIDITLSLTYMMFKSEENRADFVKCIAMNGVKSEDGSMSVLVKGSKVDVLFCQEDYSQGSPVDPPLKSSDSLLTVITNPASWQIEQLSFNPNAYFKALETTNMGRSLMYAPVITSTQEVLSGNLPFSLSLTSKAGVVCVAGQQTKGKGRGGNIWLSPKGCLMFSLPLQLPVGSRITKRATLIQHIVALSVVTSIRTLPGYEKLEIEIKWPNDIYYCRQWKLGGILVTGFTLGRMSSAIIGCGVNVDNKYPTICLNDCIDVFSKESGTSIAHFTLERLLAITLNKLEMYLALYETYGFSAVEEVYYQYWMHSGSSVEFSHSGKKEAVKVTGIDEYGFLRVTTAEGKFLSLQPDGNTFDVLKGLIATKEQ